MTGSTIVSDYTTGGIAGMLFDDFCLTIVFLMLASLVIAVTLVPLLCYFLLDEKKVRKEALRKAQRKAELEAQGKVALGDRLGAWYRKVLGYFVRHLWAGMGVSVAMVVLFAVACLNTRMVLMPEMDQGMVSVTVSTPMGSELDDTAAIADRVVEIAQENVPELESIYHITESESSTSAWCSATKRTGGAAAAMWPTTCAQAPGHRRL